MNWDGEKTDTLKTLWSEGVSATRIAIEIGGTSRNGVLGKVFRMGLQREKRLGEAKVSQVRQYHVRKTSKPLESPLKSASEVESNPFLDENGRKFTLLSLKSACCKWPIGDPQKADFHFCGHRRGGPGPYCPSHSVAAYTPLPKRIRRS